MGYMITTNIIHKQPNIPEFTKYPLAHPVQTPTAQIARILQICAPSPPPSPLGSQTHSPPYQNTPLIPLPFTIWWWTVDLMDYSVLSYGYVMGMDLLDSEIFGLCHTIILKIPNKKNHLRPRPAQPSPHTPPRSNTHSAIYQN